MFPPPPQSINNQTDVSLYIFSEDTKISYFFKPSWISHTNQIYCGILVIFNADLDWAYTMNHKLRRTPVRRELKNSLNEIERSFTVIPPTLYIHNCHRTSRICLISALSRTHYSR